MVTPEERITRLEAMQEANVQQSAQILTLLSRIIDTVEAARQEARDANEAARKEAREANETVRREAREANETARKEARNLFIAGLSIGAALFTGFSVGTMTLLFRVLERLPA